MRNATAGKDAVTRLGWRRAGAAGTAAGVERVAGPAPLWGLSLIHKETGRRRIHRRQQWPSRAQSGDGQFGPPPRQRAVITFEDEPDAGAAEFLDGEQSVAEGTADILDLALPERRCMAGQ